MHCIGIQETLQFPSLHDLTRYCASAGVPPCYKNVAFFVIITRCTIIHDAWDQAFPDFFLLAVCTVGDTSNIIKNDTRREDACISVYIQVSSPPINRHVVPICRFQRLRQRTAAPRTFLVPEHKPDSKICQEPSSVMTGVPEILLDVCTSFLGSVG